MSEWIYVTDRLPDTDRKVLCCTVTKKGMKNIVVGYHYDDSVGTGWATGMNSNVIALMEMPEPPEG